MICERCGSTIPEGQKFCGQCGAPAPSTARPVAASTPPPAAASQPAAPSGSRLNTRTCLLVGLGCLVILAIGACLAVAFFLPIGRAAFENVREQFGLTDIQQIRTVIVQPVPDEPLPVELATPTAESIPDFCADPLCLSFPFGLGFTATASTEPAQLEPDFWAIPEHLNVVFAGYPLTDTLHTPHIGVYDTASFRAVNPNVGDRLDELQALLDARPAAPDSVPLVPVFNAAQMITAAVEYIDFDGGSGVRFVTQYGQAVWPINNKDMFYAFTGLSDDGSLLITAIMPVANQALPDDAEEVLAGDMQSFEQGYEDYLAATESMLDSAPPASFTPNLDLLDDLMGSIQLTP
jgi:hypothetical protein